MLEIIERKILTIGPDGYSGQKKYLKQIINSEKEWKQSQTRKLWKSQADRLEEELRIYLEKEIEEYGYNPYYGGLPYPVLQKWGLMVSYVSGIGKCYGPEEVQKYGLKTCREAVRISQETGMWPPPLKIVQKLKYSPELYELVEQKAIGINSKCRTNGSDYHPNEAIWIVAFHLTQSGYDYLIEHDYDSRRFLNLKIFNEEWDQRITKTLIIAIMNFWPVIKSGKIDKEIMRLFKRNKTSLTLHGWLRFCESYRIAREERIKGIKVLQKSDLDKHFNIRRLTYSKGEDIEQWLKSILDMTELEILILLSKK